MATHLYLSHGSPNPKQSYKRSWVFGSNIETKRYLIPIEATSPRLRFSRPFRPLFPYAVRSYFINLYLVKVRSSSGQIRSNFTFHKRRKTNPSAEVSVQESYAPAVLAVFCCADTPRDTDSLLLTHREILTVYC